MNTNAPTNILPMIWKLVIGQLQIDNFNSVFKSCKKLSFFRRVLHELTDKAKHIREKLDNFLTMAINHRQTILYSTKGGKSFLFLCMSTFVTNCLTNWSIKHIFLLQQNGMETVEQNNQQELMLFRHHFFAQPGLLLRHHQEQQMKIQQQQQQLLSQWFQKEGDNNQENVILLKDGTCQWPGCEKNQFASKATFQHHLNSEHALSQCSAAQVNFTGCPNKFWTAFLRKISKLQF